MNNFHALLNRNGHIELKSSVKSVAADQIKRACQNYWGAAGPPGQSRCFGTAKFKFKFIYSHLFNYNTTTIRKNRSKNRANYTLNYLN